MTCKTILLQSLCNDHAITTHEYSRWLVLSSTFFMGPCAYAYYYELYAISILLFITSACSANHWRDPQFTSIQRRMDQLSAKTSFGIFFVNGIVYIRNTYYLVWGYSGLMALLYCYYMSHHLYIEHNVNWYKYHMGFHSFVAIEQTLVLFAMLDNNAQTLLPISY
jgi:hypothetical protein